MVSVPVCDHLRECAGKSLESGGQEGDSCTYSHERWHGFEQGGQWLENERGKIEEVLCCENRHNLVIDWKGARGRI